MPGSCRSTSLIVCSKACREKHPYEPNRTHNHPCVCYYSYIAVKRHCPLSHLSITAYSMMAHSVHIPFAWSHTELYGSRKKSDLRHQRPCISGREGLRSTTATFSEYYNTGTKRCHMCAHAHFEPNNLSQYPIKPGCDCGGQTAKPYLHSSTGCT